MRSAVMVLRRQASVCLLFAILAFVITSVYSWPYVTPRDFSSKTPFWLLVMASNGLLSWFFVSLLVKIGGLFLCRWRTMSASSTVLLSITLLLMLLNPARQAAVEMVSGYNPFARSLHDLFFLLFFCSWALFDFMLFFGTKSEPWTWDQLEQEQQDFREPLTLFARNLHKKT